MQVEINLPINKVVQLFIDKNNFKAWKKGFISYKHIHGIPGEVGALTKLVTKQGIMYERIVSMNLPAEIIETYEHKRGNKTTMIHKAVNHFVSLTENKTLVEVKTEVIEIHGVLMKFIIKVMARAGEKFSQDQLNQFKVFSENSPH
jgi:hypothetical protein